MPASGYKPDDGEQDEKNDGHQNQPGAKITMAVPRFLPRTIGFYVHIVPLDKPAPLGSRGILWAFAKTHATSTDCDRAPVALRAVHGPRA
jgi:hypothetical protein